MLQTTFFKPSSLRRALFAASLVLLPLSNFAEKSQAAPSSEKSAAERTILFYGNSMVERFLEQGELEARLQLANPALGLKVRSLAWTGDEVGHRLRLEGYAKHMKNLLTAWPASTIVLGYGLNESFAGEKGLPAFRAQYKAHLDQLKHQHPEARFIFLSPIAIEGASADAQRNVALYSQTIAELATEHDATFVDLFTESQQAYSHYEPLLTTNGIHLNQTGNSLLAPAIADAIVGPNAQKTDPNRLNQVALAAAAKHKRVAEIVRPKNGVVYFGVRARAAEYKEEMPRYHEMIRLTEAVVHQIAQNPDLQFADLPKPSLPPLPERTERDDGKRTGIIKPVAEAMAEFTVAEGFEVNIFASEEDFPELRNPVQIAFDARGRLWAVTMPSFPHTVPGLTPPDRIVILEDTDQDGKADKLTTFMDGLDALDGVAFHKDGVIVSEQPRLWLMKDTDGDDRADTQIELLRGIDVTDSHHGGMIATDPSGDVIFCDGVFHRSQLETPFGVHRGIDATTYRLNMNDGSIVTEWQHTTPNPWKVSFDQWGGIYQNYGDGHVYDCTSLIWGPLGAYQPFRHANIASYGKGSGSTIVSGPNFPDKYQQRLVSASLLGRYAVTLTAFDDSSGIIVGKDPLTILDSPNAAFRPADLEFGMDGALYISDFCSPIIGHAQHPMRSPHWDHDFGRIWRVVHTGKPLNKDWPTIQGADLSTLCNLLTHPQDLVRKHARIEIRKHGAKGLTAVEDWLAAKPTAPNYLHSILEALFVIDSFEEVRPDLLRKLLTSSSEQYQRAGLRLTRQQAHNLANPAELLSLVEPNKNPRTQIELIDAVAHLRPTHPEIESVLANLNPLTSAVKKSLAFLDNGIEPLKGRSVPVLEVDKESQLAHWLWFGKEGDEDPTTYNALKEKLPPLGLYRSFIHSNKAQPAVIAVNHRSIDVRLNESLVFSQNSLWSGDQQINVELQEGLNVIEIFLKNGRRKTKSMPPVYVYDPVGRALREAEYPNKEETLKKSAAQFDKLVAERGEVLRVQTAAGLLFSPTELTVTAGSKVRLIFENPDVIVHNWVLIAPNSSEEIGTLADKLASQADGAAKEYLPESDKILLASKLLAPGASEELVFTAPTEPGNYPYLCTFPGHWRIMQGILKVEAPQQKKKPGKTTTQTISEGVFFETAPNLKSFHKLIPSASKATVTSNPKTNNEPLSILTDGRLSKGFGSIFPNGTTDGAYKMDLAKSQKVTAITSWSHSQGARRGTQSITLFGSNHPTDPGWDTNDSSRFAPLGTMSSKDLKLATFSALSRQAPAGESLGTFRWIIWKVSPISNKKENTAFQELAVEVAP